MTNHPEPLTEPMRLAGLQASMILQQTAILTSEQFGQDDREYAALKIMVAANRLWPHIAKLSNAYPEMAKQAKKEVEIGASIETKARAAHRMEGNR